MISTVVELLQARFSGSILSVTEFRNETTVAVRKDDIVDVCTFLRDDEACRFEYLSDLCGADAYTPENRFEVIYNLLSLTHKHRIRLKTFTDETAPHMPSVTSVWPGAEWPEREAYDMYGIIFDGNNDLRRMYMPEDFEYYPLRKDYPLMGIPGAMPLPRK
jgi:NADH-quinone oxidoreductase subunit C